MAASEDESQQTLTEDLLLQQVLDRQRTALEAAGQNAPWLRPSLQSDVGTQNLIANLGAGLGGKEDPDRVARLVSAIHSQSAQLVGAR